VKLTDGDLERIASVLDERVQRLRLSLAREPDRRRRLMWEQMLVAHEDIATRIYDVRSKWRPQ